MTPRWSSALATVALLLGLVAVLGFVGLALGGAAGGVMALLMAVGLIAFGSPISARWMLRRSGARVLKSGEVLRLVETLSKKAGIRAPVVMLIPSDVPNALATGEGKGRILAVSTGLLRRLSPRELRCVLAHEIAHLQRGDTFLLRVVAVFESFTRSMSRLGMWLLVLQLPLVMFGAPALPWSTFLVFLVAPTVAALLRLAVSRSREYAADAGAVALTGDPQALAAALTKLDALERRSLFAAWAPSWLRTHPATRERVGRLVGAPRTVASDPVDRSQTPPAWSKPAARWPVMGPARRTRRQTAARVLRPSGFHEL
ncbi:MAG: zinc metalloprotease HtpX [Myxococcota bacterium]